MNDKMYIPKVFDNIDKERTITAIDCDGNKTEITFMCKALGGFRHDGTRYLLDGHYFLPAERGQEVEFNEETYPDFTQHKYNLQYVRVIHYCGWLSDTETAYNQLAMKKYDNGYVGIPINLYCYDIEEAIEEFHKLCEVDASNCSLLKGYCDIMLFDNKGYVIDYKEFNQDL